MSSWRRLWKSEGMHSRILFADYTTQWIKVTDLDAPRKGELTVRHMANHACLAPGRKGTFTI